MGSGSSRMGRSSESRLSSTKHFLSSLICGGSTSHTPSEIEECPTTSRSSIKNLAPVSDELQSSRAESSSIFGAETGSTDSKTEVGTSSGIFGHPKNVEASSTEKCLLETRTPYEEQPCLESVFANERVNLAADAEADYSANTALPLICPEDRNSTSAAQEHHDGDSSENHGDAAMGFSASPSGSLSVFSGSPLSLLLLGDDTARVAGPLGSGFLVSDTENDPRGGSLLHVDVGSHDRWLLDLSGDLHYDGVGRDFGYLGSRGHRRNERRWELRSEVSERPHSTLNEGGRRTTTCASGLHPDGTCSCESFFMAEESSALASISRIVMLAEALFEVLDEIHRQPLSFSLSTLSLPAPESVVNSFLLKNHKKLDATENEPNDVQQCHICLAEYEEGDEIRVLPCHHEYHMLCVDKWLKEVHGVCPICRCNVSEGVGQGSVSNADIPSQ
ncbi:hypothetical protein F0562_018582 [Nyssa sinensis]|uniref:RING-type domain-containing protein n=1 Tax=Nyssa sinensis TaxID=561372 RepID=A0A5J4ZEV1_9ASTE|nr:hypothetical protein F0562_018582 [Nyssa sinensis]